MSLHVDRWYAFTPEERAELRNLIASTTYSKRYDLLMAMAQQLALVEQRPPHELPQVVAVIPLLKQQWPDLNTQTKVAMDWVVHIERLRAVYEERDEDSEDAETLLLDALDALYKTKEMEHWFHYVRGSNS